MELNYRVMGEGEPLIILHGLYGSSDNWLNIARELAGSYRIFLPDQRNHGHSPHNDTHTYEAMREDLREFMDRHQLPGANILGHSMGGKTAIYFAAAYPERVNKLIVVDIGPSAYPQLTASSAPALSHLNITQALYNLDTEKVETLREADQQLAEAIPYLQVRQFLLKNLKRNKQTGRYQWLLNIRAIRNELPNIMDGLDPERYSGPQAIRSMPVLFIRGERSPYIGDKQKQDIHTIFPQARIETIENAGHWVHAEKRKPFLKMVNHFLEQEPTVNS